MCFLFFLLPQYDYADHIVVRAFQADETDMETGNQDFRGFGWAGRRGESSNGRENQAPLLISSLVLTPSYHHGVPLSHDSNYREFYCLVDDVHGSYQSDGTIHRRMLQY